MMNLGMDWSDIAKRNDPRFPKSHGYCSGCGEANDLSDMEVCDWCVIGHINGPNAHFCNNCWQLHNNKEHQD
jgi:hypothetical protein